MSVKSWKQEFAPTAAKKHTGSDIEALEYSIRKWKGARKENLDKHHLIKIGYHINEKNGLIYDGYSFGDDNCPLCLLYKEDDPDATDDYCPKCPLTMKCLSDFNPYIYCGKTGDPEPMIKELEDTLQRLLKDNHHDD